MYLFCSSISIFFFSALQRSRAWLRCCRAREKIQCRQWPVQSMCQSESGLLPLEIHVWVKVFFFVLPLCKWKRKYWYAQSQLSKPVDRIHDVLFLREDAENHSTSTTVPLCLRSTVLHILYIYGMALPEHLRIFVRQMSFTSNYPSLTDGVLFSRPDTRPAGSSVTWCQSCEPWAYDAGCWISLPPALPEQGPAQTLLHGGKWKSSHG